MHSNGPSELLRRVALGDVDALAALYRRHRAGVHALCLRMTGSPDVAEDLTQEVFLRAARAAGDFRGDAAAGTWLYRIARHACLDRFRGDARRAARLAEATVEPNASGGADDPTERRLAILERALLSLPIAEREVVVLARFVGLDSVELAEVLECSPGAARVRLHRSLVRLRRACIEMEETDELRTRA